MGTRTFALADKASIFLDQLYHQLGGEVIQRAPNCPFDDWDKIVRFPSITYKIEEKTMIGHWPDLLVELIEDLKTGDLGWFYQTKADRIIYCYYEDDNATQPHSVYALPVETMKAYVFEHAKELMRKSNISSKGYGLTLNLFVDRKLAKCIWPNHASVRSSLEVLL